MKLTKSQSELISTIKQAEEKAGEKLWIRITNDGKWFVGSLDKSLEEFGFRVHGKTVKSLSDKNIIVFEKYNNVHTDSNHIGMTLNNRCREAV